MLGGKTACHKVNKLLSVQISLKCVDLRPILFSSPCVTSVTFDSQKFFTFIHSFRHRCCSPWGKYQYFCCKNNNNKKIWCIESTFTGLSVIQQSICVGTSQDYVQAKRDLSWWKNFDYPKLVEKNSGQTIEKMLWKPGRGMCRTKAFVFWEDMDEHWQWRQLSMYSMKMSHKGVVKLRWH